MRIHFHFQKTEAQPQPFVSLFTRHYLCVNMHVRGVCEPPKDIVIASAIAHVHDFVVSYDVYVFAFQCLI